ATKIAQKERRIVLVGVEPDYPATGFGYIKKGQVFDDENFVFNVDSFKEKPDYATAQHYVQSGDYLWNSGYFIGSIDVFLEKMKQKNPLLHKTYTVLSEFSNNQALYKKTYQNPTEDTIDYALIEKLDDSLVVPASFD